MNQKKKKKWPWVVSILAVVIAAAYLLLPKGGSLAILNTTRTATVEKGDLAVTVIGTGNLEYDDALDVQTPSGIVIDEVLVESGDAVAAGDVLATINPISIQAEIDSVRNQVSSLDKEINSTKASAETEAVKTNIAGRVKKIYVEEGDAALDVYFESGALLLLSVDEKMAVDFESTAVLSIGDTVDVILEDGSAKEGTVERKADSSYTVTLTDNGPELDEEVTIETEDGDVLGTGTLYIHQPIKIVATYGDIKTVHVSENEKVSAGVTLITLENLPVSASYEQLISERDTLLDQLDALLVLSKTNTLTSNISGVVVSVGIKDGETVDGTNMSSSTETTTASNSAVSSTSGYPGVSTPSSSQEQTSSDTSTASLVTAFTIAPSDNVVLSVNVDELDILSIGVGMEVQLTIDAIPNQTFGGEIVKIADSATASSGVAKYVVKVLVPKDISMRAGMNATATILVENKEGILLIPVAALQETDGRVYVYTQQNTESGELSGIIDVVTGISDGEKVEIISGLSQGDTVYYKVTESEAQSSVGMGGFGGGISRDMSGNINGGPQQ